MEKEFEHHEIYEMIGGEGKFTEIVDNFYQMVQHDELLIPMYPEQLEMARMKLTLFLIKKFGGPDNYTPLRGGPQMKKRHSKFSIGIEERNHWVEIMGRALDISGIGNQHEGRYILQKYFEWMASHMINQGSVSLFPM